MRKHAARRMMGAERTRARRSVAHRVRRLSKCRAGTRFLLRRMLILSALRGRGLPLVLRRTGRVDAVRHTERSIAPGPHTVIQLRLQLLQPTLTATRCTTVLQRESIVRATQRPAIRSRIMVLCERLTRETMYRFSSLRERESVRPLMVPVPPQQPAPRFTVNQRPMVMVLHRMAASPPKTSTATVRDEDRPFRIVERDSQSRPRREGESSEPIVNLPLHEIGRVTDEVLRRLDRRALSHFERGL